MVAESVLGFVDEIAERATALSGLATGTVRMAADASSLDEYPLDATSGEDTVNVIADRLAAYGAAVRGAIDTADAELGDMTRRTCSPPSHARLTSTSGSSRRTIRRTRRERSPSRRKRRRA